jgi:F0F1-type ATP synthase assembly protein I
MDSNPAVPESPDRRKQAYALLAVGCVLVAKAFVIGLSDNPPGILSLLLGGFAVIMGIFYRFAKPKGRKPAHEFLYWAPRALCITFALFTSVFALDVFEEGHGFWTTALGFIMHLTPTFILLVLLALSWRWEWIGGPSSSMPEWVVCLRRRSSRSRPDAHALIGIRKSHPPRTISMRNNRHRPARASRLTMVLF